MDKVYFEERQHANAMPHRRYDLEAAILNLQLGPLAEQVHAAIDRHLTKLPPADEQGEYDRIWRLALHRMDLRQYTLGEKPLPTMTPAPNEPRDEADQKQVVLNPKPPDADLQEMVSQSAKRLLATNERLGLEMWGSKVFCREDELCYDPVQWRARLAEARAAEENEDTDNGFNLGRSGPALVAAVCARDRWDELSDDEKRWCADRVCHEVERHGNRWGRMNRVQRNSMSSDRPCASVVPLLLGRALPDDMRQRVAEALVVALTHPVDEVRLHAARSIGAHLWSIDREMALRCVNTLATEARLVQDALDTQLKNSDPGRRDFSLIEGEIVGRLRRQFFEPGAIPSDALRNLDPSRSIAAEAYCPILCIVGEAPTEPVSLQEFGRASRILVEWWDSDKVRNENRRERNYETESAFRELLQEFLFQVTIKDAMDILEPILEAIEQHPRQISWLLLGIIETEDRRRATEKFWNLWQLFADRVRTANWLKTIDDPHSEGQELLTAVLLGSSWKENVRHWQSLEGHAGRVHALFEFLPASPAVMEDYLRFLYHVGEQSLPGAFLRVAKRLEDHNAARLIRNRSSIHMLETLLRRHVYGRPLELKVSSCLRDAVLRLLDNLVEVGSSAAFRMRDDFVTPVANP